MTAGETLLRRLPPVLRAREYHLYLEGGTRLVDLWQDGGRAILGHKPPLQLRELKNAAERGLLCPLPHPQEARFHKALARLFPGRVFRQYASEAAREEALRRAGLAASPWRPFAAAPQDAPAAPVLAPVLPWPLAPWTLVLDAPLDAAFPPGDIIPPALLAPATRALHDLVAAIAAGRPVFRKINAAVRGAAGRTGAWRAGGVYLYREPVPTEAEWAALWDFFLGAGFLLPPAPRELLILPAALTPGEEARLAAALAAY